MQEADREEVLAMMLVFYDSPAILTDASEEVLRRDIADCIGDCPYLEGFVFEMECGQDGAQSNIAGYAMAAKSYSTEYGGMCVWIEDLYLKPEYRNQGIGTQFFAYIEDLYRNQAVRFRLEVERENTNALALYHKCGYKELPYIEMTKETE